MQPQPSKRQNRPPRVWLDSLKLLQKDRNDLLSPTAWVTDSIVNAAQHLLRQHFPQLPGLQDVLLGQTMAFNVMAGEFLQILHTSEDHWLTISTIGEQHSKIKDHVYDSMFNSIPTPAKTQIASLLCSTDDVIEIHLMEVQMQVFNYSV